MRITTEVRLNGILCVTSVPRGSKAWRLATSVFCPLGPSPTQAWVLMGREDLKTLVDANASSNSPYTLTWEQKGTEEADSVTLTFSGLYLVKAERIMHGGVDDQSALYLLELADSRWRCQNRDCGSIRANIRSFANDADFLTETEGYTWASLVQELWEACGLLGAFPGLPPTLTPNLDGAPDGTYFIGLSAWRCLCAVLNQLDCAVDHDPLSNTYTIVQLGAEQTIPDNEDTLQWDGQPMPVGAGNTAANLRIYFYFHRKSYGQERDTELGENWAYNGQGDFEEIATDIPGASGMQPLWDDLAWILDEDNAQVNAAEIATRRDNRKARYVLRVSVEEKHRIHAGLHDNLVTGGQVRAVMWRNWDDSDSDTGGTVTEFIAKAGLVGSLRQTEFGPAWFDHMMVPPEQENYAAPDLGRRSYPTYPRLPNIVKIVNTGAQAGEEVEPNTDGFHKGKVARWVANALVGLDDCWIRFVDRHDELDGQVTGLNGDYYGPARLSGISTSDGETLPVYTVKRGELASNRVVRFKLTATLDTGTNAEAVIKEFNGTTYPDGTPITVFDSYGITNHAPGGVKGMFKGVAGMEGYAVERLYPSQEGALEFEILWMEQWAWHAEVELMTDIDTESQPPAAIAQASAYYEQGVSFQDSTIFVYDELGLFPHAKAGAKAHVRRDEYRDTAGGAEGYYLIQSQQIATMARAVLAEDMCGIGEYAITDFTVTSFSPFNQNINPDTVFNDFGKAGNVNDIVWLNFDDTQDAYVVVAVTMKEQKLITHLEWTNACIKYKDRLCVVESCEEESDLKELICFNECEEITP